MRKRFDVVLLDADDTVFDFKACERAAFMTTMEQLGLVADEKMAEQYSRCNDRCWKALERGELTREQLKSKRFEDFFAEIGAEVPDCAAVNTRYMGNLSQNAILLPGALEFVQKLHDICRVYITTNGISYTQNGRMSRSEVRAHIDGMYISEDVGCQKPDPRYFDAVFADLGITDRSRVCIIGDSLTSDMQGGRNAGITTVLYLGDRESVDSDLCDYEIAKHEDFFDILYDRR